MARKHSFLEDNLTMIAMAGIAGAFVLWQQGKKKTPTVQGAPSLLISGDPQSTAPGLIGCDCGRDF